MIYLCSIYSLGAHGDSETDKKTREGRYQYTMKRTAELIKAGNIVFSPILHSHSMAEYHDLPKSYEFFKKQDRCMIERSDQMVILDMKTIHGLGWESSEGVSDEEAFAKSLCRPVFILPCPDFVDYGDQYDLFKDFGEEVEYNALDKSSMDNPWAILDQDEAIKFRYPSEE
jgi:hypothetical protein